MLVVALSMFVVLALAGLVLVYAAYPNRGARVPAMPWIGDVMAAATDVAPVLDAEDVDRVRV